MKQIHTDKAPAAIGPYAQAIRIQDYLFMSGQLGIDPKTGEMPDSIMEQTKLSLSNLGAILDEAGIARDQVVKTTIFLVDMDDFALVNLQYADFFGEHKPARSTVAVAALPKGGRVEIECIAVSR